MARQYRLMSADGHLEVPPERWIHRVPEKYRERAPHTVKLPDGGDALMIEGQPLLEANFLDLRAGRAEGTWTPFGLKVADAAGTGGPEQRVKEQDQDGMDGEILSHEVRRRCGSDFPIVDMSGLSSTARLRYSAASWCWLA